MSAPERTVANTLEADLNYLIPDGTESAPVRVQIKDGRMTPTASWQEAGFELVNHTSQVSDWDDDAEVARVHYKELVDFALEQTGADVATIASHIKRNPTEAARHTDLAPITFVHSDFAPSYGEVIRARHEDLASMPELVIGQKQPDEQTPNLRLATRILILQFWRNLGPTRMDLPIAFCDPRSIPVKALRYLPVQDYAGSGTFFEAVGVESQQTTQHDWRYFPEMTRDEMVVFRTFDTQRQDRQLPDWTPHSAFRDPDVKLGEPSRSSIECRVHCFFFEER
jgi:hypothetical protein